MNYLQDKINEPPGVFEKSKFFLFSFLTSFIFLFFLSKNSPLYPLNTCGDVNTYFTIGRSLLDGKVPYLDLVDHKGPMLYFFYAAAALVSKHSHFGVFILELCSFSMFLYYNGRVLNLFSPEKMIMYLITPLTAFIILGSPSFCNGGSVEEMSISLFSCSFYIVLNRLKRTEYLTKEDFMLLGLFFSMLFWIKFTLTGFYFGLVLFISIWYSSKKQFKKLLMGAIYFLLPFFLVTCVIFLFYYFKGALDEMLDIYFFKNIFSYATSKSPSEVFRCLMKSCYSFVIFNDLYFIVFTGCLFFMLLPIAPLTAKIILPEKWCTKTIFFVSWFIVSSILLCLYIFFDGYVNRFTIYIIIPGVVFTFLCWLFYGWNFSKKVFRREDPRVCGLVFLTLFMYWISNYSSNYYPYYFIIFSSYLVFGWYFFFLFLQSFSKVEPFTGKLKNPFLFAVVYLIPVIAALCLSHNLWLIKYRRIDMPQSKFSEIIKQRKKNAKILVYDVLDCGFYMFSGQPPSYKYFSRLNIPYVLEEQKKIVDSKDPDFIVTINFDANKIIRNYRLIKVVSIFEGGIQYQYQLFEKRTD